MGIFITAILILMSDIKRINQNHDNGYALIFANKFDFVEQFIKASEPYAELYIQQPDSNTSLKDFHAKYSEKAYKAKILNFIKESYTESQLTTLKDLDAEDIINYNKDKFKSLEDKIENLFNELYIEGNRLLSGIKIVAKPNQSNPFGFFTVDRANGIYIAKSYDSYLPQNIQIHKEPIIAQSNLLSAHISNYDDESQWIILQLDKTALATFSGNLNNLTKEPIVLIINKRIINISSYLPRIDNDLLRFYSPWSPNELKIFAETINKK